WGGTWVKSGPEGRHKSAPPKEKPVKASVKGNDALARSTPNLVWTAGSATTEDHMPTQPIAPSRSATASRSHAYGESLIVVMLWFLLIARLVRMQKHADAR